MCENWERLYDDVLKCDSCELCESRKTPVLGAGAKNAKILLVGEAPGENEDKQGEAFVGRSGKLLGEMLAAVGLVREKDVYIANILKCRPPQNRTPKPAEAKACAGFLQRQIELIAPQIILCLGRVSAQSLIDKDFKVTQQHGQWQQKGGIWLMGTFHPASLLRNPRQKPYAASDFILLRKKLDELSVLSCRPILPQ